MKLPTKILTCLFTASLLCSCTTKKGSDDNMKVSETVAAYVDRPQFRFSSTFEKSTSNEIGYKMTVPYTDTYNVSFNTLVEKYSIYDKKGTLICEASDDFTTPQLTKGDTVYVIIKCKADKAIKTEVSAVKNISVLPYESNFAIDASKQKVNGDNTKDPLKPAEINYIKRKGGTYINSNNPELLTDADLNKALCRDTLEGEVFFTFEHNNGPTVPFYYGYQVKNNNNHPIYITIKNIGYQLDGPGSWLGEDEWIKFYNTEFEFDKSNWNESQMDKFNSDYGFSGKYKSANYQPVTVCLPAGQQIYVAGGTTQDSYLGFSAFGTADRTVKGGCSNVAVLFNVAGGKADGAFYVYTNPKYLENNTTHQGYIIRRPGDDHEYGSQYIGRDNCHGVVDNEVMWTFNDQTASRYSRYLPVSYTNYYDENASKQIGEPFEKINSTAHRHENKSYWVTHINPQNSHEGVGTDMTDYNTIYVRPDGKSVPITIGANYRDGNGRTANIGNWMIDYQDRFTFVNQGDYDREITLALVDNGSSAVMVLDKDGNILDKKYTMSRIEKFTYYANNTASSWSYLYTIKVPAHSVKQITLEYNLLANSSGYLKHAVFLGKLPK